MRGGRSATRRSRLCLSGSISMPDHVLALQWEKPRGEAKRSCNASPKLAARGHCFQNLWASAHRRVPDVARDAAGGVGGAEAGERLGGLLVANNRRVLGSSRTQLCSKHARLRMMLLSFVRWRRGSDGSGVTKRPLPLWWGQCRSRGTWAHSLPPRSFGVMVFRNSSNTSARAGASIRAACGGCTGSG
jgi:hypothetical protein